jgi:exosortase
MVLFVWGWQALRWAAPSIVFLIFMYPLTGVLFDTVSLPLQRGATSFSAYLLQIVGIPAFGEGTVLNLPGLKPLGVEAACCGLRMIVTCLALCFGASFFIQKSLWEKVIIVASSVPIAVFVNVVRITVTGAVADLGNYDYAVTAFHDSLGLFTMPMAIALLWTETWAITHLFGGKPRPRK